MSITMKELARLAGVSTATVSVVLNGKDRGAVGGAKRVRVLELAKKFKYRSNLMAKGLAQGRTFRIAVCMEEGLPNMFSGIGHYERVRLFSYQIADAGYAVEFFSIQPDMAEDELCRTMSAELVDGFVFSGVSASRLDRLCFSMREKRLPTVCPGSTLTDPKFTWTDVDRTAVFELIAGDLIAQGHKQIALIHITGTEEGRRLKSKGFVAKMRAQLGVKAEKNIFATAGISFEGVFRTAERVLDELPGVSAIILGGNIYYEAVLLALQQHGVSVGRDCRVIGAGVVPPYIGDQPHLSHYSYQIPEQAAFCMEALLEQLQDFDNYQPRHKCFPGKYIPGDT